MIRIGNGFDIHRFGDDPDKTLVLGGVEFAGLSGLVGHSDGDVIAHACADALLGAAGLGDIGGWFPDDDPALAGADSIDLLARVAAELERSSMRTLNIDCSVVCEQPKLAPQREAMQARLSAAVGAPVTVKGRRAEGVGEVGAGVAIVCYASALIEVS